MSDAYMPTPYLRQLVLGLNPLVAKLQQLYESSNVGENPQWRDVPFVKIIDGDEVTAHQPPSNV